MKTISKRLAYVLATVLAVTGLGAFADGHEPAPQPVLESFICNMNPGQDRGDLDSATDYYMRQADKAGITPPAAYLWTKIKGTGADMIWHNVYGSMGEFAAQLDATGASSEMAAVTARYDTVTDCMPMLGGVNVIHERSEDNGGEGAFVAGYACRASGHSTQADYADLNRHIGGVFGEMSDAPIATYMITPMTTDIDGVEAVYFNVFESASHWAAWGGEINGNGTGQMLVRHFNSMLDCSTNLWASEQVVAAPE